MFALRASCSSLSTATRRCPSLVSRLYPSYSTTAPSSNVPPTPTPAPAPDALSFFPETNAPPGPTPFAVSEPPPQDEGPPTAPSDSFPKQTASPVKLTPRAEIPVYKLHCHSSSNNTIVTFTKPDGSTIAWFSGGSTEQKFKKANRATFEAGYQCAMAIFKKIREWNTSREAIKLEVLFKGYGEGREAMKTALLATEGAYIRELVCRVTDRTPIKIGGTRAKKMRRG